ncbi:MAG: hypothetical protein QF619_03730 [Candidatus Binatia bacterium]|nr:hypothetical protein [Candidatus Binatia bacterium]
MKGHTSSQVEEIGQFIDPFPTLGQIRLEAEPLIQAGEGAEEKRSDTRRIGVRGITRVEVSRVAFKSDRYIAGGILGTGRGETTLYRCGYETIPGLFAGLRMFAQNYAK